MKIEDLPKITDKIHLPTSVTALATISRLMKEVVAHEPLSSADSKPLFMAAKTDGIRKKAAKADTHTEGTFRTFGLIEYTDVSGKIFRSTQLGKEVAEAYDISGNPRISADEITALSLRVLCSWTATNGGRNIHPGRILLDLLSDIDVDGYVTEHEFTNFLIDATVKTDDQYIQAKNSLLAFRALGADAICDYTETCKTYLFLPSFVNKWNLLKKGRIFDFAKASGTYRWTMGADASDEEEDEDAVADGDLYSKHSKVTEYRLLPKALEIYKHLNTKNGAGKTMVNGVIGPLQKISYGAPGTGKSKGVNDTALSLYKEDVVRTTFHPDSDYSTFVGAYKPTMDELPRVVMDGTTVKKATFDAGITPDEKMLLGVEKKISYEFVPQAFAKAYVQAWKRMAVPVDGKTMPVMLVIEEINRGDCAKVFGDLFQLLDRRVKDDEQNPNDPIKKVGFSEYPVLADSDLADYIRGALKDEKTALANAGYGMVVADENLQLVLPPNMYIWATMNTSDQSLFPMDSAFKRRWDWKYVPIEDKNKDWKIKVGTDEYRWWSFLELINDKIAEYTSSEDKQLGYFFAQPGAGSTVIETETFVSKVIFYLWKDVFRDDLPQGEPFKYKFKKGEQEKEREIRFTDFYQDGLRNKLVGHFLEKLGVEKVEPEQPADVESGAHASEGETPAGEETTQTATAETATAETDTAETNSAAS